MSEGSMLVTSDALYIMATAAATFYLLGQMKAERGDTDAPGLVQLEALRVALLEVSEALGSANEVVRAAISYQAQRKAQDEH